MASTPQSQARQWLRAVAREGARYVASLPAYEDAPYASLEAAAHHYRHEHRDGLYLEEYIRVDTARRPATLAVRWVSDDGTATGTSPRLGQTTRTPATATRPSTMWAVSHSVTGGRWRAASARPWP